MSTEPLTFIDFFAGVGGFHLGLSRAGIKCVGAVEIDPFSRRVYEARFGNPSWFPADINTVTPDQIPDADVWAGGSPCQDFSIAGKRAGLDGERSGLLRVWLDLFAAKRPRFLLFENVYGIFSAHGGLDWGEFIAHLDEIGYSGAWRICDARWFGVPQRRRRVFLIAERGADAGTPARALFEAGKPSSSPFFRKGSRWLDNQGSLFGALGDSVDADRAPDWGTGGWWSAGRCETARWTEAPEVPVPSSLRTILEYEAVPQRFFLSPRAAAGILRRAERRGRELPASLRAALDRVAVLAPPEDLAASDLEADEAGEADGGESDSTPASGACPIDEQETIGGLTRTYGSGAELHSERIGRDCNQLVMGFSSSQRLGRGDVADTLRVAEGCGNGSGLRGKDSSDNFISDPISFDLAQITHPTNRTRPEPGQPSPSLAATNRVYVADVAATIRASDGHHGHSSPRGNAGDNLVAQMPATARGVRRFTPLECELLFGLPAGHTCLCGTDPYSTGSCTCPDGPRYRVCGNGVAVPVVEWIGVHLAWAASVSAASRSR